MAKSIKSELKNLVIAGIVSPDIAVDIENYFNKNANQSQNKLVAIFGILGAILCGLGIILILAHNWDDLSMVAKSFISFVPLFTGQFFCGFSLFKKNENIAWRESSSVFLFFAIGASISLIAQIYNISGDFDAFVLTWSVLALPLVYCLRSSMVSLLYIIGITVYCCNTNYFIYPQPPINYWYFLLLLGVAPHYFNLLKTKTSSNFTWFHNWFLCISILISIAVFSTDNHKTIYVIYTSMLAIFYFIGKFDYFESQNLKTNSFYILGKLGTIFMLFLFSFQTFWSSTLDNQQYQYTFFQKDVVAAIFLFSIAAGLLIHKTKKRPLHHFHIVEIVFILSAFFVTFGISMVIVANILILIFGITEIKRGTKIDNFGILNYGLSIITILVLCRFFDTDFSFAIRGLLFLAVGCGFFFTNYLMLKKRKHDDN